MKKIYENDEFYFFDGRTKLMTTRNHSKRTIDENDELMKTTNWMETTKRENDDEKSRIRHFHRFFSSVYTTILLLKRTITFFK